MGAKIQISLNYRSLSRFHQGLFYPLNFKKLEIINKNYRNFFFQVHDTVVESDSMTDNQKSAICEKLAVSEARLLDGASEFLQMLDIISFIMNQLSKS